MKTAVSIPDHVFEEAERLAKRQHRSRSEIYSRALAEYLARQVPDQVTEAMNRALDELEELEEIAVDSFTGEAARRTLERCDW